MTEDNPLQGRLGDELLIGNVTFGTDAIEIDFFDPRRQGSGFAEMTKLAIDRHIMLDEIEEIEERLRDIIDETLTRRRK